MKSAKQIVAEAWELTLAHRSRLFAFGFVASFFSLLVSALYLWYQVQSFRYSPVFGGASGHFLTALLADARPIVATNPPLLWTGVVLASAIFGGWFFLPMLCRAAIAHIVGEAKRGRKAHHSFMHSVGQFFPLFTTNALKRGLEPLAFFTEWSFVIRNAGMAASTIISPLLITFGIFGAGTLFFFLLTTPAIAIAGQSFAGALALSTRLIFEHTTLSLRLLGIFLLIELRVLINVFLVFALPALLLTAGGILARVVSPPIGGVLGGIFAGVVVLLATYLSGILVAFSEVLWTITFLEFYAAHHRKD